MTADDRPRWRRLVGVVEDAGPPLAKAAGTDTFARVVGVVVGVTSSADRFMKAQAARVWHALNLPSASDVNRLRELIADVDRQVQQIQRKLDAGEEGPAGGSPDSGGVRTRSPDARRSGSARSSS